MRIEADGTYPLKDGWEYARDYHGGIANLSADTVIMLLGVSPTPFAGEVLANKSYKCIGDNVAVYNYEGKYRIIMRKVKVKPLILIAKCQWCDRVLFGSAEIAAGECNWPMNCPNRVSLR